jgi:hypothetical protein
MLAPNALSRAIEDARRSGIRLLDLTEANPTTAGLSYPPDVLSSLSDARAERYHPEPLGLPEARAAVAAEYARYGATVPPDRVVLTSSTSEAYGFIFKLTCDPGDAVLVPQPSYPLFDMLAGLDGVARQPYRLEWHGRWSIDRASVERALGQNTRAVLVVSPNNPTGSLLGGSDRDWIVALCRERGLALVVDEVFLDYPLAPDVAVRSAAGEDRALVFSLGGLSKSAGLPQVKLGWMVVSGPTALVAGALDRLALISDTYLSVSTPVQVAAPRLMEAGGLVRARIAERTKANLAVLRDRLVNRPDVALLQPEAGWSAVLQVPATESEEALALRLVRQAQVVVHPGYFFDFPREAFLVVSLLPNPAVFREAIERLFAVVGADGSS